MRVPDLISFLMDRCKPDTVIFIRGGRPDKELTYKLTKDTIEVLTELDLEGNIKESIVIL